MKGTFNIFLYEIQPCIRSLFDKVTSAFYGSCYSFNSNVTGKSTGLLSSSLPGPVMGLTLVLGLDQQNYMGAGLTKGAGARFKACDA